MDLIDSIKSCVTSLLPRRHRCLLAALTAVLVIVTHERDYDDLILINRHTEIPTSTASIPPLQTSDTSNTPTKASRASLVPVPPSVSRAAVKAAAASAPEVGKLLALTPNYVTEVKAGDNLSLIFARAGLTAQDVYQVSRSKPASPLLNNLYPGYTLEFFLDNNQQLTSLTISPSKLESTEFSRTDDGSYITRVITREPEIRQVFREATIEDSLFLAAQRGGISASITMELAGIFGGVIDFLLDTRRGDRFNLLYEEKYLDGEYIGNGAILAAQFTNQGETYTAVRYVNTSGDSDFYNPDGESMRKAFLRNPVDFTRISSSFSLSRKHPILNTIRAHKGTDYAAPTGTPVVAAGDGRITWAAHNGSFGKLVVVQHGERFQTKYAHLNDYARGVKNGARVRQGQVIGYVGATGSATGPHLHYEFLMDGVHRNSRTIHEQLPKAESVPAKELPRFHDHSQALLARLEANTSDTRNIALNTVDSQQ